MTITSEWVFMGKYWVSDGSEDHYKGAVRIEAVLMSGKVVYKWAFLSCENEREPVKGDGGAGSTGRWQSRWTLLGLMPKMDLKTGKSDKPNPNWSEGYFDTVWDAVKDAEAVLETHFGGKPKTLCSRELWHPLLSHRYGHEDL